MTWFVYYRDGYWEDGDVGFVEFDSRDQATEFINTRIRNKDVVDPNESYTVIEGWKKSLKSVERVFKVKVE